MGNKFLSYQMLLVSFLIVGCCQQIWAGRVVKGTKYNIASSHKDGNQTTRQAQLTIKLKTTATTIAPTTTKPVVATTTLSSDFNLDGRSAFINNEFVTNTEETISNTAATPLEDILQQQMQTALKNTASHIQGYDNDPAQIKELIVETKKLPAKTSFGYNMDQLHDYDDEETELYSFESGCMPTNCQDNHKTLENMDIGKGHAVANQSNEDEDNTNNSEPNIFESTLPNSPYDFSNYKSQTNHLQDFSYVNKPNNGFNNNFGMQNGQNSHNGYGTEEAIQQPNDNSNSNDGTKLSKLTKNNNQYNTQNNYGQVKGHELYQQHQHQPPSNHFVQSKPLQHFGHSNLNPLPNLNYYEKTKSQSNQNQPNIIRKTSQNLLNSQRLTQKPYVKQQIKPGHNASNKPLYDSNYTNAGSSLTLSSGTYNEMESLGLLNGNSNTGDRFNNFNISAMPSILYGNSGTDITSPFSTTFGHNKKFRTVSSATQYVSTPLADLVLKYSIGMAKRLNMKLGVNFADNRAQLLNNIPSDNDFKGE